VGVVDKLTEKQKRFADYYIETGNASESAIRAGYSKGSAKEIASQNLTKLNIKSYIEKNIESKDKKRIASQDEVLEYLTSVLRGEIIEECAVTENIGDFRSEARIIEKQVAPKDRNKAAELLAKRYGLLTENLKLGGEGVIKIINNIPVKGDDDGNKA
jgi:phage terminase small subunit